jgi:hypothetical protein
MNFFFSGHKKTFPPEQKTTVGYSKYIVVCTTKTYFPPEPKSDTTAQPARQTTRSFFFQVVIELSGRNKKTAYFPPEPKTDTTAQPARQTTGTFFSGRNKTFPPQQKNWNNCTTVLYTKYVRNTKNYFPPELKNKLNIPPEPKTDTTAQPARQMTRTFFSGLNKTFPPQQKNCLFPARTKNWHNSTTRQTDD